MKRHGIHQLCACGKILSSDQTAADDYKIKFKTLLSSSSMPMEQVYNCDKTGLNFKMLPSKSLVSQNEACIHRYKVSKEHLMVLACSNVTGTNKMPLMVIWKSAKPWAFKNVNMNSLPVQNVNMNSLPVQKSD